MLYFQGSQDMQWVEAMDQELQTLEKNQTWNLTSLSKEKKAIDSKWVYKVEFKPIREVDRFKDCLVTNKYNQVEGVDYKDRFSPVAKIHVFIAITTVKVWLIFQLDVNNAFLYRFLDEEVYMTPPQRHSKTSFVALLPFKGSPSLCGTSHSFLLWQ